MQGWFNAFESYYLHPSNIVTSLLNHPGPVKSTLGISSRVFDGMRHKRNKRRAFSLSMRPVRSIPLRYYKLTRSSGKN
jgi:hypothetical protein